MKEIFLYNIYKKNINKKVEIIASFSLNQNQEWNQITLDLKEQFNYESLKKQELFVPRKQRRERKYENFHTDYSDESWNAFENFSRPSFLNS